MANETPQIQDAQPVLSPVNINSAAEGYESFAKTLASLASTAESKTEEMASDQSQAMYINSVANIEQLKTSAQIQMLEHPDQAPHIAQQTDVTLESIKKSAFVNSKDRTKLNSYISGASDDVRLKAVGTEVKQRQLEAAFTHYANWPDQLKAYNQALLTNHAKAETLKNAMVSTLHSLVSTGAISPEQAGTNMKSMQEVVGVAQRLHEWGYGEGDVSAKDYHTIMANPLNDNKNNPNAPINASTQWLIDYHNSDKTFQGVLSDINKRMLPSPEAISSMTPAQNEHAMQAMQGVQIADGMINSGEPLPVIQKALSQLSEKGRVLSYREEATKNALESYTNELKNGNYLSVIGQTPAGNSLLQNFVQRDAAIKNLAVDPAKKNAMLLQNKNQMVDAAVSYGEAHHMPGDYIQPIPQADVAMVENGFKLGQDPATVLQTVGQYSKRNQMFVAQALKNPEQNMVVQAVALSGDSIKPQDKLDMIAANQVGRAYLNKDIEGNTNDQKLMTRISSNLSDQMRVLQNNYDTERFGIYQNAMLTSTLKYAKFLAQKDNNIGALDKTGILDDRSWTKYVDQASRVYATAFNAQSGTNWLVNKNQLPAPLTDTQLDVLADHVIAEGYKYLKEGRPDFEYESAISRNPLRMVMSPSGEVQAVDGNGKVYYSMPFTTNVMPYVEESKKARAEEKKRMLNQAIERHARQLLNVRLPDDANAQ